MIAVLLFMIAVLQDGYYSGQQYYPQQEYHSQGSFSVPENYDDVHGSYDQFENYDIQGGYNLQAAQADWTPNAGLIVAIEPNRLCADQLARSWTCIDQPYRGRQVRSRPMVKTDVHLAPSPSFDGANIMVRGVGSSAGETSASTSKADVYTDSLTEFKLAQQIFVNFSGIAFEPAQFDVRTNLDFNRAKSKKPMGGLFAATPYKRFPKKVQEASDTFARQKLAEHLQTANHEANRGLQEMILRFQRNQPTLAALDWQMSSDSNNVFLAAGFGDYGMSVPPARSAVQILLHEQMLTDELNWRLSSNTFTSEQIMAWLKRTGLPGGDQKTEDEKQWMITFLKRATDVRFKKNTLDIRMGFDNFQLEDRVLPKFALRVVYKLKHVKKRVTLVRDGELQIHGSGSGARQHALRSIIRRRLDSVLPQSIPLRIPASGQRGGLAAETFVLKNVTSSDSVLNISLDRK